MKAIAFAIMVHAILQVPDSKLDGASPGTLWAMFGLFALSIVGFWLCVIWEENK